MRDDEQGGRGAGEAVPVEVKEDLCGRGQRGGGRACGRLTASTATEDMVVDWGQQCACIVHFIIADLGLVTRSSTDLPNRPIQMDGSHPPLAFISDLCQYLSSSLEAPGHSLSRLELRGKETS